MESPAKEASQKAQPFSLVPKRSLGTHARKTPFHLPALLAKRGFQIMCSQTEFGNEAQRRLTGWRLQLAVAISVLPLISSLAGCVTMDSFLNVAGEAPDIPCQVVATWNPGVVKTPDPTHDGELTPGLVGRIYLFGSEIGAPLIGDGSLVVALYDDTAGPAAPGAPALEQWQIDRDTLKRLQRRDAIGGGYTVFLPWGTYKPEINRVHLKVRYIPPKGVPLYAAGSPITLGEPELTKKTTVEMAHGVRKNEPPQKESSAQTTPAAQGIATVAGQQPIRPSGLR